MYVDLDMWSFYFVAKLNLLYALSVVIEIFNLYGKFRCFIVFINEWFGSLSSSLRMFVIINENIRSTVSVISNLKLFEANTFYIKKKISLQIGLKFRREHTLKYFIFWREQVEILKHVISYILYFRINIILCMEKLEHNIIILFWSMYFKDFYRYPHILMICEVWLKIFILKFTVYLSLKRFTDTIILIIRLNKIA